MVKESTSEEVATTEVIVEKRYYLKITGSAWDVRATTPEEAIDQIRVHAHNYCSITALEIGVECDENGYLL